MMDPFYNENNDDLALEDINNISNNNKSQLYQQELEQRNDDNENNNNNCIIIPSQSPFPSFYSAATVINEDNNDDSREDFHTQEIQVVADNAEKIMMINSHDHNSFSFPSSSFASPTNKSSSLSPSSLSTPSSSSSRPSSFSLLSPPPLVPRKSLTSSSSFTFNHECEDEDDLSFLDFPTFLSHDEKQSSLTSSSSLLLPRLTSLPQRILLAPRNFCFATTTIPHLEVTTEDNNNNSYDVNDDNDEINNVCIFGKKEDVEDGKFLKDLVSGFSKFAIIGVGSNKPTKATTFTARTA